MIVTIYVYMYLCTYVCKCVYMKCMYVLMHPFCNITTMAFYFVRNYLCNITTEPQNVCNKTSTDSIFAAAAVFQLATTMSTDQTLH